MNWKTIFAVGAILLSGTLYAQTPDGETPANEGVCDELLFATPGLYGMCVAFCEAQDCEPDFALVDPFARCHPSNPRILQNYDKKKRAGDPDMPCVQTECPCFTASDLEMFSWPPIAGVVGDLCQQSVEFDYQAGPGVASDVHKGLSAEPDHEWVISNWQFLYSSQEYVYQCGLAFNGTTPPIRIYHRITPGQEEVCRSIIDAYIEEKGGCPPGTGREY